jgi:hypothetical protein
MITDQRMLFPEPATIVQSNQCLRGYKRKGHTFPLDPQGTSIWLGLPLHECHIIFGEPCRRPLQSLHRPSIGFDLGFDDIVVFDILISGMVWRRQPRTVHPHPVPFLLDLPALCKDSVSATNRHGTEESRTLSFGVSFLVG